ncbi:MAG: MFS transporter [Sphingomonadales bacterium]|nr:MFS transporter [Sphingomonadales bacterium]MBK7284046.1 MFS transporter [Sphingomonadales bacterium]MBL0001222.1 MFS transporter [Sphingomonadales bacterium]MBL0114339.1 MFS transporter [Sphingomonadales bacterium]
MREHPAYRYYVLALLTLTLMFSVADRLVLSILLQDIKRDFALSDSQLGLLAGFAFTLFYVIAGFPMARLADRANRKSIVAAALGFWSLMTALSGAAVGFWSLFLARIGVGMGEGGSGPSSQSLLADYFRPKELPRAMGFLTLGSTIGTAIGLMAGGLFASLYGWRMSFILLGIPGMLLGLLLFTTVREPQRGRYSPGGTDSATQRPLGATVRSLLANRAYLGLIVGYAVQIMIGYAIAIWMAPIMLRSFALTTREVGFYLGLAFVLGGIPGPILGGVLGEWLSHRDVRWFAWIPGLAGILCLPPLWLSLSATTFWPFLGLFALAYGIFLTSQAPIMSSIQNSVLPSERGFAVALAMLLNNFLGQALSAAIIGRLSDFWHPTYGDFALNLAVMAVCLAGGIIGFVVFAWTARQMRR